ncbi:MAG: 30S ribosomal protein S16 [Anaplasmataceae bacterium]|nr:30S ribosomal protein S16 [Anaplasmataceae bacterium]
MLAIKLQKIGRKHQPSFRLVVAEKRSKLIAPPVEDLGNYQPALKTLICNRDRVLHWLKVGAQPTTTVHNLLVKNGVIPGPKRLVRTKKPAVVEAPAPTAVNNASAPVSAEEPQAA